MQRIIQKKVYIEQEFLFDQCNRGEHCHALGPHLRYIYQGKKNTGCLYNFPTCARPDLTKKVTAQPYKKETVCTPFSHKDYSFWGILTSKKVFLKVKIIVFHAISLKL
ncbi:unnamed protein product [Debaryomyces tyrocola]|nr:unnamed protein product [Debaryomyces tyrocola]